MKSTSNASNASSRRGILAALGLSGAAAATLSLLPKSEVPGAMPQDVAKPAPAKGGGYSLSEHVKRYYQTTRL
jgi:hypothetical protein